MAYKNDPEFKQIAIKLANDKDLKLEVLERISKEACLPLYCTLILYILAVVCFAIISLTFGIKFQLLFLSNLGVYVLVSFFYELLNCYCIKKIWNKWSHARSRVLISIVSGIIVCPLTITLAFTQYYDSDDKYDRFNFDLLSTVGSTVLGYVFSWCILPYGKRMIKKL